MTEVVKNKKEVTGEIHKYIMEVHKKKKEIQEIKSTYLGCLGGEVGLLQVLRFFMLFAHFLFNEVQVRFQYFIINRLVLSLCFLLVIISGTFVIANDEW